MGSLVEIARFDDPEEAFVANSLLRARGINTIIQNEHHLAMAPYLRVGLGGYRILCVDTEKKAAQHELNVGSHASIETLHDDVGSAQPVKKKNWLWLPVAFSFGVPFLLNYRRPWYLCVQIVIVLALLGPFIYFWLR